MIYKLKNGATLNATQRADSERHFFYLRICSSGMTLIIIGSGFRLIMSTFLVGEKLPSPSTLLDRLTLSALKPS
jgi:hypothetical protein